jgi:hypothetical protein
LAGGVGRKGDKMKSLTGKITALVYGLCNSVADNTMILCGVPLKQRQAMLLNDERFLSVRREIVDGIMRDIKKILEGTK